MRRRGPRACTRSAVRRRGPPLRSRRRARAPSGLHRPADVFHGDPTVCARALEMRQFDAELVGYAPGGRGGVELLGAPPAALAQVAHLAGHLLGQPGGTSGCASSAVRLPISLIVVGAAGALGDAAERLPCALAGLPGALGDTAERLPCALAGLPGALGDTAERLPCALARLPDGLTDAAHELIEVTRGLSGALPDVADGLSGALADVADGLSGALADVADRLSGALADVADRLSGAFADVTSRLPGALPDFLQRPSGALAYVLGGIARLVDCLTRALADLGDRATESLHQLRIAVEARHQAIDDCSDVIEPTLEDDLRLDTLDVELDSAEVHIDAHGELDEIQHASLEGDMSVEVVELEVDQVDP